MKTERVAAELEELAEYLRLDGQRGRARAYSHAANEVRKMDHIPANPAEITGVGDSVREDIADYLHSGKIPLLVELKENHSYYEAFRSIDGVGPATAKNLHAVGITTKAELEEAIEDGSVLRANGVGKKTAKNIKDNM